MFYQIFLSPQVKRKMVISIKHGIYQLPHKLPNDFRLRKLGNIRKISKFDRIYSLITSLPSVPKGVPATPFEGTHSFKIFVSRPLFFVPPHPLLRYFIHFPHPHTNHSFPNLTHQPYLATHTIINSFFKQISNG